ncbi:inositol monophosphatase [Lelliottia jeotgali]|nr:inositol monophosphatase [Lelliottia jeotgali]
MNRNKPSTPLAASHPYDGFWFQPVIHAERSQQKVPREELPAQFQEHHSITPSKQRGLL